APEKSTTAGRRAAAWVTVRLKDCQFVVIKTYKTDKYARYLVDVFYQSGETDPNVVAREGAYLNSQLLEEGLAVKWS
ncbi:MAG: thermonuclease family protein, partial [Candidatus Omnitrophica bacterium]|nr:thermonuclease family protein [Candidatus Omnitrophota bacterium]